MSASGKHGKFNSQPQPATTTLPDADDSVALNADVLEHQPTPERTDDNGNEEGKRGA